MSGKPGQAPTGKFVGICGQGPSDHLDPAAGWLLDQHIDTMSLNPDTIIDTWLALSQKLRSGKPPRPIRIL